MTPQMSAMRTKAQQTQRSMPMWATSGRSIPPIAIPRKGIHGDTRTRDREKAYTDSQLRTLQRRVNQAGVVGTVVGSKALNSGGVEQKD